MVPVLIGKKIACRARVARHEDDCSDRYTYLEQFLSNDDGTDTVCPHMLIECLE